METPLPLETSRDLWRKLPLAAVAGLCALSAHLWILAWGMDDLSFGKLPLFILCGMAVLLSIMDLRIGLGILLFAVGLSPEFEVWGISNLRLEDFLFPVIFIAWLLRSALHHEKFLPTDLKMPILLLLVLSVVSSTYNAIYGELDILQGAFRIAKSVQYFLIFLVALNVLRREGDQRAFVYLVPMVGAIVGVYGIFQSLESSARVTGPVGETSNILGGYFVLHICLAVGVAANSKRHRLLLFFSVLLMLIPLLRTLSRTSYVALFAGLAAVFFMKRNLWSILLAIAFSAAMVFWADISERFMTIIDVLRGEAPNSLVMRFRGWMVFLEHLPETPVIGQGVGNKSLGAFDNEYVRQLFELGVLGLLVFFWMLLRIVRKSLRVSREPDDGALTGFGLGCFGATVALLVHSMGATTFTTIRTSEPFFFALGILYAVAHNLEGRSPDPGLREELPQELPDLIPPRARA